MSRTQNTLPYLRSSTDYMCVAVVCSACRDMDSVGPTAGNQYHCTTVPHNAAVFVKEIHPASVYTQPCSECTLSSLTPSYKVYEYRTEYSENTFTSCS